MSEFEYDPFEYAEALAEGEGLGGSDLDEARRSAEDEDHRGLSRRDLLVRGGLGAAAVGGLGALAGPARGQAGGERQVHRHAPRPHARRRVPDPGHREAGLQGPGLHRQADPRAVREAAADRDHVAGHVRRLRRLQLPVAPGVAVRRPAAGRHAPDRRAGIPSTSCSRTASSIRPRHGAPSGTATHRSARRSSIRTARPGSLPTPAARRATSRSSAGSARTASRSAASRSRAGSSARRRTSTPTRWATTPT